ncbi:hypoxanthine phosphoribosyltransferase [Adhaeribacter pallidiroseus]|uniref:Hypoxanthine phosphoribosyltransferase n=1 Tax=Adhaeribacter pallidiroseus TaxID=2072847 RepID=A0A369QMM7_9BACT|nr:hypoxanthine phosphoribosyltransferase [Adhaeribacter pallidiroseus]RDC64099.1 Hypoxanthine phosphoribosyltransferase [Adhaeribacter pallidiroseus]
MSATTVQLHDKEFEIYLQETQIKVAIEKLAARINEDYTGKRPLFLAVLNGSFMFASDLMKEVTISCEISFIKLASYQNTQSTGTVKELVGLNEELTGRDILILEDIVDTGHTVHVLLEKLQEHTTASVEIASLLLKPACLQHNLQIKYAALSIPNDFVVGYGLDYNGLGRNLRHIYKLKD